MKNINKEEIHTIFKKIKNGDENAIEELYNKYSKLIISISFSILKNNEASEEISQMIYLKILQMPIEKLPDNNELTWLYAITKNQSIDYIRKQRTNIDIDTIYDIKDSNNKIDEIIDIDTYNNMINCLKQDEKEIVSLKVLGNFTFKEIGLILNIPTGTVQWKYYKAVHTLKLLISNLSMFIITTILYINIKIFSQNTRQDEEISKSEDEDVYEYKESTMNPSSLNVTKEQSLASDMHQSTSINRIEVGLFSISTVFLILTIFFGLIWAKHKYRRSRRKIV